MLKNNNKGIIRRLAVRSLRSGKMRNIFIMITVAISAAFISGLAGFSAAYDKNNERELAQQPQAEYRDVKDFLSNILVVAPCYKSAFVFVIVKRLAYLFVYFGLIFRVATCLP